MQEDRLITIDDLAKQKQLPKLWWHSQSRQKEIDGVSEIDLIIRSAQALKTIEYKQFEHDERLSLLEAKSNQNSGYTGYFTISAWCKFNKKFISLRDAKSKGREAKRISKEWGVDIGRVPDERYGEVNSYREDILEEVFGMGNCF
jgi:hypothetical protein